MTFQNFLNRVIPPETCVAIILVVVSLLFLNLKLPNSMKLGASSGSFAFHSRFAIFGKTSHTLPSDSVF